MVQMHPQLNIILKCSFCFQWKCFKYFLFLQKSMFEKAEDSALQLRTPQDSGSTFQKRSSGRKATLLGCEKGDFEVAVKHIESLTSRYQNGQEVSWNADVEHFKQYGTGIYLFFHFAKRLAILFGIFALISIVPVILNATSGDAFSNMIKTFGVYFARTTVANLNTSPSGPSSLDSATSRKYKLENAIPDIIMSFAFLAFYLYWEVKSDRLTEDLKGQIRLQCHQSLELHTFPSGITERQVREFFSQFGKVKEVSIVQNYSDLLGQAKDIYDLSQRKKQFLLSIEEEGDAGDYQVTKERERKAIECEQQIAELENKFASSYKESSYCVLKIFVVFEDISARQKAIKTLNEYNKCWKCKRGTIPQEHLLGGELVGVSPCHNEPGDIIWQNLHVTWYSRLLRGIAQIILLILVLAATFLVISLLNIATPSTSTYLDVTHYDHNTILNVTNSSLVYVWCIDYKSQMSTYKPIYNLCSPYITRYYTSLVIGVMISCIVVGVKFVIKKIVIALAKFQRYHGNTEQSIGITRNLFYTYVCTTSLITVLLQASIFGFSFKKLILSLTSNGYLQDNGDMLLQFHDFVPFWFVDIGYKINMTVIIMALQAPLMTPVLLFIKEKWRAWRAKSQLTQRRMEEVLMPENFEIEDHYANTLLLLFLACAFSSGMPIILIPCGIALILRYFYYKLVFVRFNLTPPALDEALNESVINILPWILCSHFLFGVWMFSSSSVFPQESSFVSDMIKSGNSFSKNVGSVLMRLGDTWYFTITFLVCMVVIILKVIFYDVIYESYKARQDDEEILARKIQVEPAVKIESSEEDVLLRSYKIESNPRYFEILGIMNRLKSNVQ